tara:strand:+ start:477 stop:986 length:510 start_codon:yes stop_codon:yes gene_type:complete
MGYSWSVWLLPKAKDNKIFTENIKFYSNLYATDRFLPHVTLFGRMNVNPEPFYSFFNKIKSESEIEKVHILNIKVGDSPSKRMYMQLSLNKNLLELQKKINKKFKQYRNYEFDPHVSLAYGNFTLNKKDISLISHKKMISFSSIAIVNTPNEIKKWNIIQKFDSLQRVL